MPSTVNAMPLLFQSTAKVWKSFAKSPPPGSA